jgi:hypothetical protein
VFQNIRRKPTAKNTHIVMHQQELGKGANEQKEEREKNIFFKHQPNIILIVILILTFLKSEL